MYAICNGFTRETLRMSNGKLASTCHPDDGMAGPSSFSQILDDDGPDDGSPH